MSLHFPFDPDIARASTIPARLYTDPVYLELERERIFARSWQIVGHAGQVRETGDYFTAEIAGESIVVLRDCDALRAFHNVCLHRAGPVAYGCGRRQTMQCKYHGWTYTLRGELLRAPEMEGVEQFSPESMRLVPVQVEAWGPIVFANLDLKAPPLAHFLEDIPSRAEGFRAAEMRWVMRKEYVLASNWKVYIDNYLEGYHVPVVHPGLHKEIDYDEYRVEPHRYYSLQHAPMRPAPSRPPDGSATGVAGEGGSEPSGEVVRAYVPEREGDATQYYWLWPNIMLNVYLGQMQTNLILPLGHDRTLTIFEWYAAHPPADPASDPKWSRLLAFSDEIQREDIEICEAVQKNLRSRVYDRGRYSVKREKGVHHFHSLLHEYLT